MLTLITGAPGAGKTAALVKLLSELSKGRAIFADGIPDLKVEHAPLTDPRKWPELVPDGAAVVIDEAQRVWRPAGSGQRIPEDIAALETHRHRGLDFFIVTQHPKLIHQNVRNLVGRHIHLRELGVMGRWWYEWGEAADPSSWRTAPVKKRYRLDKASFALYRSASEHIKPIRTIPPVLYILAAAIIGVAILAYVLQGTIRAKFAPPAPLTPVGAVTASKLPGSEPEGKRVVQPITGAGMLVAMTPRLADDPGSAPAYDHLRQVRVIPRIIGGFCVRGVCRCYTQQGTDPGISHAACYAWIKKPPFDAYRETTPLPGEPTRVASSEGKAAPP